MKVAIGDKTYTVEFEHDWVHNRRRSPQDPHAASGRFQPRRAESETLHEFRRSLREFFNEYRERTICIIRDASSPSPGDGTGAFVSSGQVVRKHTDRPNRDVARQQALKSALRSAYFTRADRKEFWSVFTSRSRGSGLMLNMQKVMLDAEEIANRIRPQQAGR